MDLKSFCGTDEFRPYLHKPFSVGEFTYVTNGHIMVRLPRQPDVPEQTEKVANWDAPLEGIETAIFAPLQHGPLPPIPPQGDCEACDGRGSKHDCPDCECLCERCDGKGEAFPNLSTTIRGSAYNIRYVAMALTLPGIEFATEKKSDNAPLLFKFDGGIGAIMPIRGTFKNHVEIEISKAA